MQDNQNQREIKILKSPKKIILFTLAAIALLFFVVKDVQKTMETKKKEEKYARVVTSVESQMDKTIKDLETDKTLSTYLSHLKYNRDTEWSKQDFRYDIEGDLDASFDTLSKKEQYDFFAHAVEVIRETNKKNGGELECGKYTCFIYALNLKTDSEEYEMTYSYEGEKEHLFVGGHYGKEYLADGSEYMSPNAASNAGTTSASATAEPVINSDPSTATGVDWMQMSSHQKSEVVSSVISSLESKGYTILEGPDWFIDSLDAYYGDPATNTTTVVEIIAMSGVAGGVILEP
ncbi:hypothetical protein [Neobacillus muris]|uniref:hypothetical protein n=1 Tax=Neobacillus muris TaxID=2941334 RepID=UPI00203DBE0E|nr:hypothetical protein [Neobacillus muris]